MSNPLFDQFGNKGGNDFLTQFNQFKNSFSGNPQQMIQQMLNSGRITQTQLNNAIQQANQMKRIFGIK